MFGANQISPPKKSNGQVLQIQEIFKTFQGEAIFTGYPAIFLRLGGCNLACEFCDTEFDSWQEMNLDQIISSIRNLAQNTNNIRTHNLVVITGGEPLRQNIIPLCQRLLDDNFTIQIETNGTLFLDLPKEVIIICSPKNSSGKYYHIRQDLLSRISALKILISASNPNYNFVPDVGQSNYNIPIYLQPIDEYDDIKNQENMDLVLRLASNNGYRLSLQTHKIWKIE